ncbi:MAG: hypothetical protein NZ920_06040 [Aigarchaeota archaeon]|nr:hypothetical protein [Aigarchaeota archaeon]MDW8092666.1 hypothetical protein [Nitrososphaerota archaeon]
MRKIISKRTVSIPEVRAILESEMATMGPLQQHVLSYVRKFSKLPPDRAVALKNELIERFGLIEDEASQVVNVCPTHVEELRAILTGYVRLVSTILFSEEKLKEIMEAVKRHLEQETVNE